MTFAETYTGRVIKKREITSDFDSFFSLNFLCAPLISVSEINYIDRGDVLRVVPSTVYRVTSNVNGDGRLELNAGQSWPTDVSSSGKVRVIYTAGYDKETIPKDMVVAILAKTLDLYDNREADYVSRSGQKDKSFQLLLSHYRLRGI